MTDAIPKQSKRRWWQFRVSTLLLLTALAAVSVGWWLDHQRLAPKAAVPALQRRLQEVEMIIAEHLAEAEALIKATQDATEQ